MPASTLPREPARGVDWSEPESEGRLRSGVRTARLVLPAVLAFLVQTPFAVIQAARVGSELLGGSPPGAWGLGGWMLGGAGQGWPSPASPVLAALGILAAVAGPIALLGARRWPGAVVAICAAAAALGLVVSPGGLPISAPPLALAFAVVFAIVRGARVWALASLAGTWTVLLAVLAFGGTGWQPQRVVVYGIGMLVAVGAGEFARGRRERYERVRTRQREQRQTAEQAERVRIARELHDVLAHSLSSINVQAGMGLHLIESQPERAAEALAAIKTASKHALDDVRGVIGVLRADGEAPRRPEPGLAEIDGLAEPLRANGVAVDLRVDIAGPPAAAAQLALYRIAQESLTNVLRHASAQTVDVAIVEHGDVIELTVVDDGTGSSDADPGSGLLGMAERAALLGGTFEAGPRPSGGFRVRAALPGGRS